MVRGHAGPLPADAKNDRESPQKSPQSGAAGIGVLRELAGRDTRPRGPHSEKPQLVYEMSEGWSAWGNQAAA